MSWWNCNLFSIACILCIAVGGSSALVMAQEPSLNEPIPIVEFGLSEPTIDLHSNALPMATNFHRSEPEYQWEFLPDGLLWEPYLAAPHEPRMSMILHQRIDEGYFWDSTLGGRVGLLRYGTSQSRGAEGFQWDLEGAVITRLNLEESEDVESMDYRFGTLLTMARGLWSAKFGYFHVSSHVGDEYLERNPTFERVNYVTESLIAAASFQQSDSLRLYGEAALALKASGGAKAWQFQTGAEFIAPVQPGKKGGPFTALNIDIREAVGFEPTFTLQTGWQWRGPRSGRRFRTGFQYHNGHTSQFTFFRDEEEHIGVGIWFDY
ncbi:DUF1207 domain-containing protein [Neorhodopirellula pilleata]|uniref:DUF1207 domain-containing protein n=1 Tax=Neorhodopirellula pilleata TaxID=2714738 RepID=A0A5C6A833_9BACT|nr:DUF1207 domain-containing protein [Neorhodopirellula pilleata]TWT95550.1 hypothetical protein Pla100_31910 [Neorhodopirellula pilleata]